MSDTEMTRQAGVQFTSTNNEQNLLSQQQQQQQEIMNTPIDSDDVNSRRPPKFPTLDRLKKYWMTEKIGSTSETGKIGSKRSKRSKRKQYRSFVRPPVLEDIRPLQQQDESLPETSTSAGANNTTRSQPNLPKRFLLMGSRAEYFEMGVPLYEASIKCDWKAAKAILEQRPGLVRYSITENGETALHVAASAKVPKKMGEVFVRNLVDMMKIEDLALENENSNTALYLAVAAGNLETVKIMVKKNWRLLRIPGAGQMLPLNVAALFGNYDLVVYLYRKSDDLDEDEGWTDVKRVWLLEKCVENDMFDIALKIVKKYPNLGSGNVLTILARKPEAFYDTQSTIKWGVSKLGKYIYSVFESPANESLALQLLRIIWKDIAKKPKNEIDRILRGPPDSNNQDKSAPGRGILVMQLQDLISEHLFKMNIEAQNIIRAQQDLTEQGTNPVSGKTDQALNIIKLVSKSLASLHVESQNIIRASQDSISQDNKPNSGKVDKGLELQKLISENIVNMHDEIQKINELTVNQKALKLQRLQEVISGHIGKMKTESQKIIRRPAENTYSSRVAFIAAEMGNTEFLIELIRQYPDLIWKVNDNKQTIFHIAVKHRKAGIYNLLYEIGAMKDMITPLRDQMGNNMLHLVGQRAKEDQLKDVSGVAFQVQRELLWFKEVEKMIPPSYREQKNKDGLTPHELFTSEHKDLVSKGEKWMKGTASQCMVVATLIATIVFAAAFTVPGGYKQDNGMPVFRSKATFIAFVVADAISLFSSTASILIFLAILTSRYAEGDFLESLPTKLMFGLLTLFLSITTMTIAFSVSFFVLYHKGLLWIAILIGLCAVLPVILYMLLQKTLFFDVFRSTYQSRYLFDPMRRVLYYENPKV